ncbi:MAG TPA: hypothetical protein VE177_05165 [Candidatus Binatus sp.]|nr:hypothetical protein [Candidatus Binatus sp.]
MSKHQGTSDGFNSLLPSLIRLIAGVIVLYVVGNIILGLPDMTRTVPGAGSLTAATLAGLAIGLVTVLVVLKFGTQFSNAVAEGYQSVKQWTPLLTYFFQLVSLWMLYNTLQGMSSGVFTSAPWAYPLIFLALAIIPTIRVLANIVQSFEGQNVHKHSVAKDPF